jgi:LPXTG-site transpeptidase (sortase) family protein
MKYLFNIIIGILITLIVLVIVLIPTDYLNQEEVVPVTSGPVIPTELFIDRISVRAPIESVGMTNGAMEVPTRPEGVGWYERGIRPGDTGSAVLAGHVNWTGGKDAVFSRLHLLQPGDIIGVLNNYGVINYFIVRETKSFPFESDTTDIFMSHTGSAKLNLITCDGAWNKEKKTHDLRLVVFAEKI